MSAVPVEPTSRLGARHLQAGYEGRKVIEDLTVDIPDGSFTVIIGPNACGKSTLLRSLSRLLAPKQGSIVLDGGDIARYKAKELARIVGLLPQTSTAPDGITIVDLVSRGRHPHRSMFNSWTAEDEAAVREALARTGLTDLSRRYVDELSGGQRQRVWIALSLAQQTPILLLDEPTTYLDLSHQLDVLDLCRSLNAEGRTLVAVLHDLNQSARYATHLIAMKAGQVVATGHPSEVVTAELVQEVFGVSSIVIEDPETGTPLVVPKGVRAEAAMAEKPVVAPPLVTGP
jgi:iron complex transport system ATP-binding protein